MYSIGAVAKLTGISPYTLRYYDKVGLTPFVKRDAHGRREFDGAGIDSLALITCLKQTGMPLDEIRQFVSWCAEGDQTLGERLALFKEQRQAVAEQIHQSLLNLQKVDHKIATYQKAQQAGSEAAVDCDQIPLRNLNELLNEVQTYEVQKFPGK
ncbi:MerR family transcriptional regulator [Lactiplantibacillus sp. WILCCON 0030]|uniref:MerR family transcriptional regulator n=1 Tax=Lactiplantibacillus brownii TaxID=3069269 RepID=A0ABU1AB92_9LACO|nr:MerR family transcriptional regulator [Lactiplantibacillus brownii]MDQ7937687.1 MerR family transcriptional regulator [Lactiplantibacillus brownii]